MPHSWPFVWIRGSAVLSASLAALATLATLAVQPLPSSLFPVPSGPGQGQVYLLQFSLARREPEAERGLAMGGALRSECREGLCHVTSRGPGRRAIARDDADGERRAFTVRLSHPLLPAGQPALA